MPSTPRYQCTPSVLPGVLVVRDQLEAAVVHLHRDERRDGEAERDQRHDEGQRVDELLVQRSGRTRAGRVPAAPTAGSRTSSVRKGTVWCISASAHHVRLRHEGDDERHARAAMPSA